MKIDDLVINVNKEIQENKETIKNVHYRASICSEMGKGNERV